MTDITRDGFNELAWNFVCGGDTTMDGLSEEQKRIVKMAGSYLDCLLGYKRLKEMDTDEFDRYIAHTIDSYYSDFLSVPGSEE